jgi:hypothetical protein
LNPKQSGDAGSEANIVHMNIKYEKMEYLRMMKSSSISRILYEYQPKEKNRPGKSMDAMKKPALIAFIATF